MSKSRFLTFLLCMLPILVWSEEPEVSIIFNQEPVLTGMTFSRDSMRPSTITSRGKTEEVWAAQHNSSPGVPWGRAILMSITDPRFKNGKMPSVDIEIVYRNNSNAPVEFLADTARRSVRIGGNYGKQTDLQIARIRVDDAFFGGRSFGNPPDKMQTDGFDLRINAFNDDFEIRSIKVRGYDLDQNPDFARLLKIESINTEPDDVFLFHPDEKVIFQYDLKNGARKIFEGRYSFVIRNSADEVLFETKGEAAFKGTAGTKIPFTFETKGFAYGIYYVDYKLWEKSDNEAKPLIEKRISLGVASRTVLPKAKPDEFLYGIDGRLGGSYNNPRLLRWMELIGADILRHGFDAEDNFDEVARALPIYDKAGLQVMFICGAPWNENEDERERIIEHRSEFLEKLAGTFPQIRFYELGNEPDLKFFYGGPMDNYVADYTKLYDAVKRGNPNTVVMNGGLCFFGEEGNTRARRFVELVDPAKIDAFAYHGHGPGVESERDALNRIQKVTVEFGKTGKPFIETESGMAAKTPAQQQEQARTAIQKMVFAQSEKSPLLIWFRLLMFEEDYGSLNSESEPRPVILSYRTMVENLRGYSFAEKIDIGREGVEAYLFTENGGPGRVCVLWTNQPALYTAYLAAGNDAGAVKNAKLIDMFGNAKSADLLDDGVLRVPVSEDPVFLKWETAEPAFLVKRSPSIIDLPPAAQLVFDAANRVSLNIRNPTDHPLSAVIDSRIEAAIPATVEPAQKKFVLAARETKRVDLIVRLEKSSQTLAWPDDWTVFLNVENKDLDLAKFSAIPATLAGTKGTPVRGDRVFTRNNQIDFTQLGSGVRERAATVVFAEVESDADRTVTIGAGADWWMAWFVNGKPAYENLETGNGGVALPTSHVFPITLRKGRNLLAVQVLSGSGGWKFAVAGPDALAQSKKAGTSVDHIDLVLSAEGNTLASEKLPLQYTLPIPTLQGIRPDSPLAQWESRKPTTVFDESSVHNLFDKFPDATRWWQGLNDLSGRAWLACDERRVYFIVKAIDDVSQPGVTPDRDSLQLGLSRDGDNDFNVYLIGQKDGKAAIVKTHSRYGLPEGELAADNAEITASIEREEHPDEGPAFTVYRVSIDRGVIGKNSFFTNLLVNDSDFDARKQYLEWRPGFAEKKEPKLWYCATLAK